MNNVIIIPELVGMSQGMNRCVTAFFFIDTHTLTVFRQQASLPKRRHHHMSHLCKWATNWILTAIGIFSKKKHSQRQRHHYGRNRKPPTPSDIVLNVNDNKCGGSGSDHNAQVPPVEKRTLGCFLLRVTVVELVGGEGLDAGTVTTFPDVDNVKCHKKG
ncbi:hypothetical protein HanRHA438_Chr17g0798091 [Helianthus annuus]|nr:hypothetical protein HanIR_Chr17g0855161 [Helianthus annuus]KAJ0824968.1 hypothetical protein HanRHA438_Chr17g0798091 [Helianthus annuus]